MLSLGVMGLTGSSVAFAVGVPTSIAQPFAGKTRLMFETEAIR